MALYVYYVAKADAGVATIEALECANDYEAIRRAPAVLEQHGSCNLVQVHRDEEAIHTLDRTRAATSGGSGWDTLHSR